ncbi:MAG: hypothetical protein DSY33_03105 [Archaeoglobus sp.]|nr:MAG: hypothetical protein DSY33_03105 [Archaeoglobus sp.]
MEYPEVVCVIHLPPLPGSPLNKLEIEDIVDIAVGEAKAIEEGGADGAIVENYGDVPFLKKVGVETVASITVVAREVVRETNLSLGINVLRNDGISAIAVAKAVGADFVRINQMFYSSLSPEGWLESCAAEVVRYRKAIDCKAKIFADVNVKHAYHFPSPEDYAENFSRCLADAAVVTGKSTGEAFSIEELTLFRKKLSVPVYAGSGVTPELAEIIRRKNLADGIIVGTYIKDIKEKNRINVDRVRRIVKSFKANI